MSSPAFDTIYALASAPGRAGIAVVRVSGPGAFASLRALTGGGRRIEPRKVALVRLTHPGNGSVIDDALILWFPGPASYTGEDVVEYHIHGGRAVRESLFKALAGMEGHRLAEAGTFTRRAFENGRMDLTQAEAVADLIHAETEAQKALALAQMGGALSALYQGWAGRLVTALAYAEAQIDFSEEDLPEEDVRARIHPVLRAVAAEMADHLNDNGRGERIREGVRIAVIGAPNAGKSSLVNALARRDVAIVSDLAGTTRDVLEVALDIGGYPVILYDTAGLRPDDFDADGDPHRRIEAEGVRRAMAKAREADIRLLAFDSADPDGPDPQTLALARDAHHICVATKTDIAPPFPGMVGVSVTTGAGLNALLEIVSRETSALLEAGAGAGPALTRARHREAIQDAAGHIDRALDAPTPDLAAEDIRLAVRAIGRITGRTDVEDLLDIIFRDFCIGK